MGYQVPHLHPEKKLANGTELMFHQSPIPVYVVIRPSQLRTNYFLVTGLVIANATLPSLIPGALPVLFLK